MSDARLREKLGALLEEAHRKRLGEGRPSDSDLMALLAWIGRSEYQIFDDGQGRSLVL